MATVKFIPAVKNQTAKGLNGTLRYCCRRDKTEYGDCFLVSGVNCVAGCAYQEFLNTKRLYNKTDGRIFYLPMLSIPSGRITFSRLVQL